MVRPVTQARMHRERQQTPHPNGSLEAHGVWTRSTTSTETAGFLHRPPAAGVPQWWASEGGAWVPPPGTGIALPGMWSDALSHLADSCMRGRTHL